MPNITAATLTVKAMANSQDVIDATQKPALLSVEVWKGGTPVTGLKKGNFKVSVIEAPTIGGEWGDSAGPIEVASVASGASTNLPAGFYRVKIKPGLALAWGAGHYLVDLSVKLPQRTGALPGWGHARVDFAVTYA